MLHEFLTVHRADLIERYESKVARRPASTRASEERQHGIPRFLDQLIKALRMEGAPERFRSQEISGPSGGGPPASSGDWHNRRTARARDAAARFSLDQVVYDYGDLFQAIMELAVDRRASIDVDEFRTLNRCLDDAIAEAAVEFTYQHDLSFADRRVKAFNERLGSLAHEMRNLIHTVTLVFTAIKAGNVGMAGASGAVLDRSLVAMRQLVERALADVRVPAELPGATRDPIRRGPHRGTRDRRVT